jgi:hypothetical protein
MKLKFKLNLQQFGGASTVDINGQTYSTSLGGSGAYWQLSTDEIKTLITQINEKGRPLTREEINALGIVGGGVNGTGMNDVIAAQTRIIEQNPSKFGFTAGGVSTGAGGLAAPTDADGQVSAFNQYYQDLYSLQPGTGGAEMLGRLEESYANQAQQAATMADVGFQQAALQQASTVKAITDQVRGERMARLRAGMSESQIANQDMQMLMANVNTLNQNAAMLNDQRLQAQIGMNTSQDQAYMDFLNQANARGQIATGMAASDAGDAYQQTIRQMTTLYGNDPTRWTSQQWSTVSNQVTGQNQSK